MKERIASTHVLWYAGVTLIFLLCACVRQPGIPQEPPDSGESVLIDEIPQSMDVLFSSLRYVLADPACRTTGSQIKENFLHDPDCNLKIYDSTKGIVSPRQLFALDIDTGEVIQITSLPYFFIGGQAISPTRIMTSAACSDSNADGVINDRDHIDIYILDLPTEDMNCLTCGMGLEAINNCDYSHVHEKIVFSARRGSAANSNYLFTIDLHKNVTQITDDPDYMDFDCSWSEDGFLIVFSRLPSPWFEIPSQIWIMHVDGNTLQRITDGGENPSDEQPHGVYPIGIDADPDLNPQNTKIVFSRLKTGTENEPFGIYELIIIDIATGETKILDSSVANMVPEWKSRGILFIRQAGAEIPMDRIQCLYLYTDGTWLALETYPYTVFPLGAYGGSWIAYSNQ
jgi:Tol biopolymer transport system component